MNVFIALKGTHFLFLFLHLQELGGTFSLSLLLVGVLKSVNSTYFENWKLKSVDLFIDSIYKCAYCFKVASKII